MDVSEISLLARQLVGAEKEVERAEDILKRAKEDARRLREEALPSAMDEAGVKELTLESGEKITVTTEVYCSIPVAKREEAFAWLESNNFGGLIKSDVSVAFDRGDKSKAEALVQRLAAEGLTPEMSTTVHPQTLKAFVKEQLAKGANVPLDLFGARPVNTARVK